MHMRKSMKRIRSKRRDHVSPIANFMSAEAIEKMRTLGIVAIYSQHGFGLTVQRLSDSLAKRDSLTFNRIDRCKRRE